LNTCAKQVKTIHNNDTLELPTSEFYRTRCL